MVDGISIIFAIDGVKRGVADKKLGVGSLELEARLAAIEKNIRIHCINTQGDSRIRTLVDAYDEMLGKIGVTGEYQP